MTEDEAFVRAIVDSLGDDTPRLVYADWLDDHADPRGPYLRAELEWAKPWRSGERPADNPELLAMVVGLDPVWVARVSRPPLGVCIDHLRFAEAASGVGVDELRAFEAEHIARRAKYGGRPTPLFQGLPADYHAFMLNRNGGLCPPAGFPVPSVEDGAAYVAEAILRFHPLGKNIPLEDPTGPWGVWITVASYRPDNSRSNLPDQLLMRLDVDELGRVFFLAESRFQMWDVDEIPEVARSLSEFFALLLPCGPHDIQVPASSSP
jgi:uncharacterized protein (TIGR02996 family)